MRSVFSSLLELADVSQHLSIRSIQVGRRQAALLRHERMYLLQAIEGYVWIFMMLDMVVDSMWSDEKGLPTAPYDGTRTESLIFRRPVAGMLGDRAYAPEQR